MIPALLAGSQAMAATGPLRPGPEIYQSIGVEPVINCRGTFTIIGASVELPEVRAAMDAAAQHFVQLDELAEAVGRRLAELTGAEWGMVSAGCAAGLKHVTAACVAGGNPEKLLRIPDLTGLDKTEVVIPEIFAQRVRSRHPQHRREDHHGGHRRGARARAEFADGDDLSLGGRRQRFGPAFARKRRQDRQTEGHPDPGGRGRRRCSRFPTCILQRGATVVAYSGGKAICGPQCAGLLLGRKDILHVGVAGQFAAPRAGPRQQGRSRRNHGHGGGRRGMGEARSRSRMEEVALLPRHDLQARFAGRGRQDGRA